MSPGASSTAQSTSCGSSTTPSSVPAQSSARAAAGGIQQHGRRMAADGDPQLEAAAGAGQQAREDRRDELARPALVQHGAVERSSTATGERSARAAARTVWRASAVSAAASTPLPQTSPIATPHTPSAIANAS